MIKTIKLEIDLEIDEAHEEDGEQIPEHARIVAIRKDGEAVEGKNIRHYGTLFTIWTNNYDHSIVIDEGDM